MTLTCTHCGTALSASGRRPKDPQAPRYCVKPECQNERQRQYRERLRADDETVIAGEERRPCSGCGDELATRRRRITDTTVGRWCPKRGCQRDRVRKQRLMAKFQADPGSITRDDQLEVVDMFWKMAHTVGQKPCPDCNLTGLAGFGHPDMEGVNCKGLGGFLTPAAEIQRLWPERIPPA